MYIIITPRAEIKWGLHVKPMYTHECICVCHLKRAAAEVCYLPPTNEEVNACARVCLSVCLLARLLKNACMNLDEVLRVDRCRDMDKLINF